MATEEQLERKWKNMDKSLEKGINDDTINYNYRIENNSDLYINYELKQSGNVTVSLFNLQGQKLATIQHTSLSAGLYNETISMDSYPTGEYLLRITTGEKVYAKKLFKK